MHLFANPILAQLVSEQTRLQHEYEFLSYGLTAAWIILAAYVMMMFSRERRLRREIDALKGMLDDRRNATSSASQPSPEHSRSSRV